MGNFHILYLDNNCFVSDQIKMRLQWKGYQVTSANKEQDLLTKITHQSFDLLIINLLAFTPHAFSLLESLKQKSTLFPPIVIVSDEKDDDLMPHTLPIGCIDYVVKKPLIQNFFDQINLSVFKVFDKLQQHKSQIHKQKYYSLNPKKKLPHPLVTNGESFSSYAPIQSALVKTTFQARNRNSVIENPSPDQLWTHSSALISDQNQHLKSSFLDNTPDAVFITDAKQRIISVNKAFTKICGYSAEEILKKRTFLLNTEKFDTNFFNHVANKLKLNPFWQGEVLIRHHKGHTIPVWQSIFILTDEAGNISQSISILRDISQQKAYEETIKFQANYDSLTQLPNRILFLDRLNNAIKLTKRHNKKLALMMLDLNKFKSINDNLGHHAGDILLQETATKLQAAVRNVDTVARLGGDEFSIIVPELVKTIDADLIVKKILDAFKKPILIDQHEVYISGCIGIAIFPDDGNNSEIIQKNADTAMYLAKNKGCNGYSYYTPALQKKTEWRQKMICDMRSAMLNHEFSLHYQPIIDVETKKVSGAETLLRWNHPKLGFISLNKFIPLAEESGLIREIGYWVIEEVACNLQHWEALGLPPLQISLNQSVAEYCLPQCHIEWLNILKNKQIPLNGITFEISEKIFINDNNNYINSIKKLKQEGIRISLDGFGTGYTSLNYLKKFPLDEIKIDRSYILSMIDDPINAIFVKTIILVANRLGINIIATGIENKKQLTMLKQQCRYAQGNYFSKPLPFNKFETFVKILNQP